MEHLRIRSQWSISHGDFQVIYGASELRSTLFLIYQNILSKYLIAFDKNIDDGRKIFSLQMITFENTEEKGEMTPFLLFL